jgi:hypothetical protein
MRGMSAIGTKQTLPNALHMSAFDPKRTSAGYLRYVYAHAEDPFPALV